MSWRATLAALAFSASALGAQEDPGGLVEIPLAALVQDAQVRPVPGVGRLSTWDVPRGGGGFSFEDEPEGLYSPFVLTVALERLLGFDALEVAVDAEAGTLRARTSPGGRKRLLRQVAWLREVEAQRVDVRIKAYLLNAWPSWDPRPGAALDAAASKALAAERPWAELSASLPDGLQVQAVALRSEREHLGDYQINQTGILPTLNPERYVLREGLWAGLRCSRMPDDPRAVLEFELGVAIYDGADRAEFRDGYPLVLPRWSELTAHGSSVVTSKRTRVLVVAHDPAGAAAGRVLLITAEVGAIPRRVAPPDPAVVLRRYAWGALDRPGQSHRDRLGDLEFEAEPSLRRNRIQEALMETVDPDRWSDESFATEGPHGLLVCQAGATHDRVAAYLQREWAQPVQNAVALLRYGAEGQPPTRFGVASCVGRPASLTWHEARCLLSEIERSAGACVTFPDPGDDPIVSEHRHGLTLALSHLSTPAGPRVHVDLQRRSLSDRLERLPTPWGTLELPAVTDSWRLQDTVALSAAEVGAVRPSGGARLDVRLEGAVEEAK